MRIRAIRIVGRVALVCGFLSTLVSCTLPPTPFLSPLPAQSPLAKPQAEEFTPRASDSPAMSSVAAATNVVPGQGKAALSGTLYSLNFQQYDPEDSFLFDSGRRR